MNWFKSSYSGGDGDNCIEVALDTEAVRVRDSKDTTLRPFSVSPSTWSAFTRYASEPAADPLSRAG
ncbi:DUF397 domain-containing protein [Streptomyces sp. NBC_01257]|uniref:DUF397 domain-containing protein n=1 Tax=Streptomyces sp. NBC_01257 TaxID=2903799 RepID=UPI002DDB4F18|nr:DUF397 domain-containing protein [Streptomyces sp. NBC_01257]WRZ67350.1 DUF397 domain-containing protein [Streptomyces sp. NBC_01257]